MEKRTEYQNNALHLYLTQLSKECREKGITIKVILEELIKGGVYPSERALKVIVQGIADAMFGKDKTRTLTKEEFTEVIEQFVVVMAKCGAETPFPNEEELQFKKYYESH